MKKYLITCLFVFEAAICFAQLNVVSNDSINVIISTKYAWPVTVSGYATINLSGFTGIQGGGMSSDYKTVRMEQSLQTLKSDNTTYYHCCNLSSEPNRYVKFWLGAKENAIITLKDFLSLYNKKSNYFPIEVKDAKDNVFYLEYPKHREDFGKFIAIHPKGEDGFIILSKKHVNNMIKYFSFN